MSCRRTIGGITDAAPTDRRAELARTAYEMIAERGIDGVSMRALARRVGATTGLVTHHFLDRAELIEAALAHSARVIIDRTQPAVAAGSDPVDVLAEILPTDDVTRENWRFALAVRVASLANDDLRPFDRTITAHWRSSLPGLLVTHVTADPEDAAEYLVALVDGIALRAVLDPDGWPPERQLAHLRTGFRALT